MNQIENQSKKEECVSVFALIKQGEFEKINDLLLENAINVNTVDSVGNDVVVKLLKAKQYDLVMELMKKRNWDVNHQNDEGNTFGHILAQDDSVMAIKIVEQLTKKKNYMPNIKNNKGETAMDIALTNNYLCTAFKILEDKRFNDIDIFSFKQLFHASIKNELYGKYSKIMNFEIIVDNLEKKELPMRMRELIDQIVHNREAIKRDIMDNHSLLLEDMIEGHLVLE